jgi:hypothetical protein
VIPEVIIWIASEALPESETHNESPATQLLHSRLGHAEVGELRRRNAPSAFLTIAAIAASRSGNRQASERYKYQSQNEAAQ